MCRSRRVGRSCCLKSSASGHQTEPSPPRQIERVRVTAGHHPLFGQSVAVVRRKRHKGEPHVVIESPDGERQLLPARHTQPTSAGPSAAVPSLMFSPGSLRALAGLVATLRDAPAPVPEARHATDPEPIPRAALEWLPARDAAERGLAMDRTAAAAAPGDAGAKWRARGAVS